jgi:hypothetical protein
MKRFAIRKLGIVKEAEKGTLIFMIVMMKQDN